MLADIIGDDVGLFLDLAAYSIIAENSGVQNSDYCEKCNAIHGDGGSSCSWD